MNIRLSNPLVKVVLRWIQNYDKEAYWKMRAVVTDRNVPRNRLIKLWYLARLKRIDAFHNASFGTDYNGGASFATPPILPHGLNGIIVGHDCVIGKHVTICHQVTIMHGGVVIGDNCLIGAGAKILRSDYREQCEDRGQLCCCGGYS